MKEYAFDTTLFAVVRVTAADEKEARLKILAVIDSVDIGFNRDGVRITEASAIVDPVYATPQIIEIDGFAI